MENFALITLADELDRIVRDVVIRRIVQHQPRGLILQTRTTRIPALKFLLDPRSPAVYVSARRPPAEHPAGDFVLVLRKHLTGAQLVQVGKPLSERILEFTFRTTLPARGLEQVSLVAELFPNAPNALLLDAHRNVIAAWNGSAQASDIGPYATRPSSKTEIGMATGRAETSWFDAEAFESDPEGWLVGHVAGMGPVLARELCRRWRDTGRRLPAVVDEILESLRLPSRTAFVYTPRPLSVLVGENDVAALRRSVLSPIPLTSMERTWSEHSFPGILEAARYTFDLIEELTVLETAKAPYLRKLRTRRKRAAQRLQRLDERRERFERATRDRESAQLVVSSGLDLGSRKPEVQVVDYSDGQGRPRTIALDPSLTIRENTTRMFRAHRKAERGLRMLEKQRRDAEDDLASTRSEEEKVRSIGNWNAWHAFLEATRRNEPTVNAIRPGARGPGRPGRARGGRSLTFDGREILVGRNSRENDELTFQVASGDDFWLHAADYSGSHVIVRNPSREEQLDPNTLVRAAELAAYFSQARNSPRVEVHYTQRKFVKKPRRARPGLVLLRQFKTVTVEPRNWTE